MREVSFDHGLGWGCINHGWGRGHLIMDWVGMHQAWIVGGGHFITDWVVEALDHGWAIIRSQIKWGAH